METAIQDRSRMVFPKEREYKDQMENKNQSREKKKISKSSRHRSKRTSYYVSRRKLESYCFAQYLMDNYSSSESSVDEFESNEDNESSIIVISDSDDDDRKFSKVSTPKMLTTIRTKLSRTTPSNTMSTRNRTIRLNNDVNSLCVQENKEEEHIREENSVSNSERTSSVTDKAEKIREKRNLFIKSRIKIRQYAMEFLVKDVEPTLEKQSELLPNIAELKSNGCTNLKERDRVPHSSYLHMSGKECGRNGKQYETYANDENRVSHRGFKTFLPIKASTKAVNKDLNIKEIMSRMSSYDLSSAKIITPYFDHKNFF